MNTTKDSIRKEIISPKVVKKNCDDIEVPLVDLNCKDEINTEEKINSTVFKDERNIFSAEKLAKDDMETTSDVRNRLEELYERYGVQSVYLSRHFCARKAKRMFKRAKKGIKDNRNFEIQNNEIEISLNDPHKVFLHFIQQIKNELYAFHKNLSGLFEITENEGDTNKTNLYDTHTDHSITKVHTEIIRVFESLENNINEDNYLDLVKRFFKSFDNYINITSQSMFFNSANLRLTVKRGCEIKIVQPKYYGIIFELEYKTIIAEHLEGLMNLTTSFRVPNKELKLNPSPDKITSKLKGRIKECLESANIIDECQKQNSIDVVNMNYLLEDKTNSVPTIFCPQKEETTICSNFLEEKPVFNESRLLPSTFETKCNGSLILGSAIGSFTVLLISIAIIYFCYFKKKLTYNFKRNEEGEIKFSKLQELNKTRLT